ncbi:two-component system sensor histidine kinase DraK [Nonomuraea roseoviolacea subsp. roseoviolacea]|uniref:Signal transduction histidine-protein kinase/phosphatase MprB n=1 Tax=Nonomuraea roseoviolacea subsp. carminata TaxID=160689 RepID=A0ABT1JVX1_9ACTN|nr:HAMP domain-containing sensor histidine kinase [Nonomuraea roseoviolacea]MCP2345896.1 signal transduction histidine kinase [Nonomuraea roseoviolacea subsp. carminata]
MRRRLLTSTLVVAVIAVLLLGVPLGIVVSRLIVDEAAQELRAEATRLVGEVEYARIQETPLDPQQLEQKYPGRYIQIYERANPPKATIVGKASPPGHQMAEDAQSENGIYVRVSRDRDQVEQDVRARLLLIVALAVAALAVAVGLAIVQSRRLTLPLLDLAKIAERLGSGDARPSRHRYGIPELDQVAEVLDRSATRISDLLTREREFATDASHQLRTPLTGLTMRLEEIVAASDQPGVVREEGEAAIVQAERLTAVIDELLAAARRQRHAQAEPVSIDEVLIQQITEWEPVFRGLDRTLLLEGTRGLKALATTGGFGQVIATLLENSLRHGGGTVVVTTTQGDSYIVIEVADEGPGIADDIAPKVFERNVSGGGGTGLGLTLARALAAADGGRLELVRRRPATFAIFLRPADEENRTRVVSGPA